MRGQGVFPSGFTSTPFRARCYLALTLVSLSVILTSLPLLINVHSHISIIMKERANNDFLWLNVNVGARTCPGGKSDGSGAFSEEKMTEQGHFSHWNMKGKRLLKEETLHMPRIHSCKFCTLHITFILAVVVRCDHSEQAQCTLKNQKSANTRISL